jgi:integral membrane protein
VRDYRAGLGMPRRAKLATTLSIGFVGGLSAFVVLGPGWGRNLVLALGGCGIAWVLFRIPSRARPHTATWPPVSRWFERAAVAETVTWLALIIGMAVKYLGSGSETGVQVFGLIHGVMALVYAAVTLWAARTLRWGSRTLLLALLASVPPLGTLWFEAWAERTGRLDVERHGSRGKVRA